VWPLPDRRWVLHSIWRPGNMELTEGWLDVQIANAERSDSRLLAPRAPPRRARSRLAPRERPSRPPTWLTGPASTVAGCNWPPVRESQRSRRPGVRLRASIWQAAVEPGSASLLSWHSSTFGGEAVLCFTGERTPATRHTGRLKSAGSQASALPRHVLEREWQPTVRGPIGGCADGEAGARAATDRRRDPGQG
jgi:hypothetical protein